MCVRIILKYKIHERDEIIHDIVGFLKHEFIVSAYLIPKIAYFNKHIHTYRDTTAAAAAATTGLDDSFTFRKIIRNYRGTPIHCRSIRLLNFKYHIKSTFILRCCRHSLAN